MLGTALEMYIWSMREKWLRSRHMSCGQVFFAVFHMCSKEGRNKVFTTCSTHLMVVTLYHATFVYI